MQLLAAGDYAGAVAQFNKALTLSSDFAIAHLLLGRTYLEQRQFGAAISEFEESVRRNPADSGELAHAYAASGDRAAAERLLNDLLQRSQGEYVRPLQLGYAYLGLGQFDKAVDWIERAYRERENVVIALVSDPRFRPLADNPRFKAIFEKTGLVFKPGRPDVALR
jgi:tetratricopeptide (TPR) repeat protein